MSKSSYIDATAEVHENARVAAGAYVWNWTKVREGAAIGSDSSIGQCCYIDTGVKIGAQCKIQNGVSVYAGVSLGDSVFVGPNATFTNDLYPRARSPHWQIVQTLVQDGASIGANATIVCGVTLGKYCMVAAGAVVTSDVPDYALVMGCPARVVDYVNRSGQRLRIDPDSAVDIDQLEVD